MAARPKISIIGAGNVGATAAHWAATRELGDVVLIDIVDGLPQGKALDMSESFPVGGFDAHYVGSNDYAATKGSDIVVITSGVPRKPGMSRDDLLAINTKIVREVTEKVVANSPDCILILVSNPLDAMCHVAMKVSGFPRERVVGMAGILDTARYKHFIAEAAGVSVKDVHGFVLGGHGDTMVPLPRYTSIAGIPVTKFIAKDTLRAIVQRARDGGAEIVSLLKTGSAYYAPGAAVIEMAEAILRDRKRVLPCAAYLDGEYGIKGLFIGVPVILGRRGVEKIVEIDLDATERAGLDKSAAAVKSLVEALPL
ncbi:MAG: malate dehydrogenase [Myxococcota bacterium]